jgi:hypothetical protein
VRQSLLSLVYQPRMVDADECGTVGGMIDGGNRSTRRKLVLVLLCPPQFQHNLPGWNPGRVGVKPATNRLSYGTALPPNV